MTNPITPPPELRSKWFNEAPKTDLYDYIIEQAAQWGADQELEACCEHVRKDVTEFSSYAHLCAQRKSDELRAARRPKPPSLKELALDRCNDYIDPDGIIRRALEALPE